MNNNVGVIGYCLRRERCSSRNAPININPVEGGGGVRARGVDLMPETIPLSGF